MSVRIYVPGSGMVDLSAYRVHKAVQEYDERLLFGRNTETGQWTIYIQSERGAEPLPICAFPDQDPPHPDDALKKLYQRDALRRGSEILDEVNRRNAERKAELEKAAKEGEAAAAEAFKWGFEQMGVAPKPVYVPKEVSSGRS